VVDFPCRQKIGEKENINKKNKNKKRKENGGVDLQVEAVSYVVEMLLQTPGPYRLNISARVDDGGAIGCGRLGEIYFLGRVWTK